MANLEDALNGVEDGPQESFPVTHWKPMLNSVSKMVQVLPSYTKRDHEMLAETLVPMKTTT